MEDVSVCLSSWVLLLYRTVKNITNIPSFPELYSCYNEGENVQINILILEIVGGLQQQLFPCMHGTYNPITP